MLSNLLHSASLNQAADDVSRDNVENQIKKVFDCQADIKKDVSDIKVSLHRDFATQNDLEELRKETRNNAQAIREEFRYHLWKMVGIFTTVALAAFGFIQWVFSIIPIGG